MKPLIIYHADCTDGFGAAFAAWLKLGDEAEYLPQNYGVDYSKSENTFEFKDREIYILDFSFSRDIMDMLLVRAKRVVWLDHHKTAFEMWGVAPPAQIWDDCRFMDRHHVTLDNNKSGALLAWEYFHPYTEVPMLIKHIDDRDRWQFKLDGSKELHAALASMKPWSFEQWQDIYELTSDRGMLDLYIEGAAILRAKDASVMGMLKQARKCKIQDRSGLAINANQHISEVGHELANQSGTFGLVWYVGADNRVKCSLRSNGDYDVSAIARSLGGGGHRNAAGFETDIETLMGWLT